MAHFSRRRGRRKSLNIPGHAHELTFTCYHRYPFLQADRVRHWFAEAIEQARIKHDFSLWAYVFMPEHAHVVVFPRPKEYSMSAILSAIKEPVSRKAMAFLEENDPAWLARLTRKRGKRTERLFWQSGGGYDRNIHAFATLEKMIGYIHENPVRRGLVGNPVDWRWSSARWYAGLSDCPIAIDPLNS